MDDAEHRASMRASLVVSLALTTLVALAISGGLWLSADRVENAEARLAIVEARLGAAEVDAARAQRDCGRALERLAAFDVHVSKLELRVEAMSPPKRR